MEREIALLLRRSVERAIVLLSVRPSSVTAAGRWCVSLEPRKESPGHPHASPCITIIMVGAERWRGKRHLEFQIQV